VCLTPLSKRLAHSPWEAVMEGLDALCYRRLLVAPGYTLCCELCRSAKGRAHSSVSTPDIESLGGRRFESCLEVGSSSSVGRASSVIYPETTIRGSKRRRSRVRIPHARFSYRALAHSGRASSKLEMGVRIPQSQRCGFV
jgi:hypothetical protein